MEKARGGKSHANISTNLLSFAEIFSGVNQRLAKERSRMEKNGIKKSHETILLISFLVLLSYVVVLDAS
jgi:hypothetical protein